MQRNDAGAQLSQARKYMERELTERQLEEDRKKQKAQVESKLKAPEETAANLTFTLTKIQTDPSEVYRQDRVAGGFVCRYRGDQ